MSRCNCSMLTDKKQVLVMHFEFPAPAVSCLNQFRQDPLYMLRNLLESCVHDCKFFVSDMKLTVYRLDLEMIVGRISPLYFAPQPPNPQACLIYMDPRQRGRARSSSFCARRAFTALCAYRGLLADDHVLLNRLGTRRGVSELLFRCFLC